MARPIAARPIHSSRVAIKSAVVVETYALGAHPASASDQAIWPLSGLDGSGLSSNRWPLRGLSGQVPDWASQALRRDCIS
jgi:hypothetical protein